MRLEIDHATLTVTLSQRNLFALLHKLKKEMDGSARRLVSGDAYLHGEPIAFEFTVSCERDDEHYAKRPEPPGKMHPLTERFIRAQQRGNGSAS